MVPCWLQCNGCLRLSMTDCSVCVQWQIDLIPANMVLLAALSKNATAVFIAKHCICIPIDSMNNARAVYLLILMTRFCTGYKWSHYMSLLLNRELSFSSLSLSGRKYLCLVVVWLWWCETVRKNSCSAVAVNSDPYLNYFLNTKSLFGPDDFVVKK